MLVQEHRTKTEVTGGITVVTALADIRKLYLVVDNSQDLEWLAHDCHSTPYAEDRS